jgi:TonB family protein
MRAHRIFATASFALTISVTAGLMPAMSQTPEPEIWPEPINSHDLEPQDYPRASFYASEQGLVGVQYVVDETGNVSQCTVDVSSGHARLDQAACTVVKRWKFKPATRGGKPIPAMMEDSIGFRTAGIFTPGDLGDDALHFTDVPSTPDPEPGAWDPSFNVPDLAPAPAGPGPSDDEVFKRR